MSPSHERGRASTHSELESGGVWVTLVGSMGSLMKERGRMAFAELGRVAGQRPVAIYTVRWVDESNEKRRN